MSRWNGTPAARRARPARAATVGISLFHTVGDRERALEQINTEVNQTYGDLFAAMGWRVDHPVLDEQSPLHNFWVLDVRPTVDEWKRFYDEQRDSWWTRWASNWETYESWQARIRRLRELVKSRIGKHLASPESTDLPTTVFQDASDVIRDVARDTKHAVGDVWGATRVALYMGVGIAGLYAATQIAKRAR